MELSSQTSPRVRTSLISWVLGFLGITALIKFLPRTITYATRRWVFGLVSEIVIVVLAGLLTEKLVDRVAGRNGIAASGPRSETPAPSTHGPLPR